MEAYVKKEGKEESGSKGTRQRKREKENKGGRKVVPKEQGKREKNLKQGGRNREGGGGRRVPGMSTT